jgi:hypothetical protein
MSNALRNERGIAMMVVLLVTLVIGAITVGAALMGSNISIINNFTERSSTLTAVADAGLEEIRSRINGNKALYPDSLFVTLENGATVTDADGSTIPGVRRWLYVGPSGVTSGQYGVFGSIVAVVEDGTGNRVVRRMGIAQESFAKYAYFTDTEPSNISFGGGDQIQGPVHTNDYLKIYSSGATFLGTVATAKTVQGGQYGTFAQGYEEYAPYIPMPTTADLDKLRSQAQSGNTAFVGNTSGGAGQATMRIEFVGVDLNGDGQVNGDTEGFIRVYRVGSSSDAAYVVADVPSGGMDDSENCGYRSGSNFISADEAGSNWLNALTRSNSRCYLGGAPELSNDINGDNVGEFDPNEGPGSWIAWPGAVSAQVTAATAAGAAGGAAAAPYLFPISRALNPSFKGVIFVDGNVAISGTLRGQVTVAATGDIILPDDLVYATNPGAGTCADILGIFAGDDVIISDNTINTPIRPASGWSYRTYDDTSSEFFHGIVLALDIFTVDNYDNGPDDEEACETKDWGRGCLYLTGGIIQSTRGAVGTSGGTGYIKRYSYDQCAFSNPPPYFPTTGHFARGRYYEVDPADFNISSYWAGLAPH